MPLSEFLRMARGKLESSQQQKAAPSDFSARSDNELVELVWENGQVVMQGQSSRVSRSPTLNNLPSRVHEARFGKFGGVESIMNDMVPMVPSGDMDLGHGNELVPWLSYPMDDALVQDYVSEMLPEISGVTGNGMSTQNSFVSVDKRASCEHTVSNLHSGATNLKASSSKDRLFGSWLPQHHQTSDALGSGVTDIASNNSSNHLDAVLRNPTQSRDTVNGSTSTTTERQNIPPPTNNSSFLNFSHFSRPATLVKANVPKSDGIAVQKVDVKEKGSAANCSNPTKSVNVEKFDSIPKDIDSHGSGMLPTVSSREPAVERTENIGQETSNKNVKALYPNNNDNITKGAPEGERSVEPMVASSSVGSGNSADRVSCEQTHHSKRKFREMEESECRSDVTHDKESTMLVFFFFFFPISYSFVLLFYEQDLETESVDAKKPTHVRGSKRSRAAEVHNLSERRRRDRINEKMRALQELIPNCNKADKASMLDEAIEYLKTLQLQVQIMSMGSGLYMPPMMYPTGMQHMHPAHFQPMGVGMGFGMGMPDMNSVSSGCPIFPLQVPHFPSNFQRVPGPNLPVFGQALPNSTPRTAFVPLAPRPPLATFPSVLSNGIPSMSRIMNSGVPFTTMNSQPMCNAEASSSVNNKSNQLQPRNDVGDESAAATQHSKIATDTAALLPATDVNKEPGCD